RPGCRAVQDGHGYLRSHTVLVCQLGDDIGKEVHVRKASDAALQLFGDGKLGARTNKVLIDPLLLRRPDVLTQPGHKRQVVGKATEKGHRRMTVGVDEAGCQQHPAEVKGFAGNIAADLFTRRNQSNTPLSDANGMVPQDDTGWLYRN